MEYSNMFEAEVQQLLLACAKFLMFNYMVRYAAENKDRKEEFATLVGLMNDIKPTECPNCKKEICQDGQVVSEYEFEEGLMVTNNKASWGNEDWGTERVTKVEAAIVNVE